MYVIWNSVSWLTPFEASKLFKLCWWLQCTAKSMNTNKTYLNMLDTFKISFVQNNLSSTIQNTSVLLITVFRQLFIAYGRMTQFTFFRLWQYGLWSFHTGGKKLERFLPNIINIKSVPQKSLPSVVLYYYCAW